MRNLFKKSLAIVVALALCLTALVGAVTVNAETKTGTITSDVTVGNATVDVVFTITTDGLNEAVFSYEYDQALGVPTTIESVNKDLEVVTAETGNLFELRDTSDNGLTDVRVGLVKFTFNKPADGTYNVTLSVHSAGASGTEEILIDMKPCTATVEIKAACEHTNKTTSEEVTKAATCTEIGYKTVTVTCNDCSEVISVTENVEIPALGHKYNYVDNGDGTHTGTCANDAEHIVNEPHNFVEGTCVCGAVEQTGPVLDESLKSVLYKRQMLIRNKFGFYFTLVFGSVEYDDFEFTVSKREISPLTYSYSGDNPSVTFSKSKCDANSYPQYGMYYLSYAGISIYEMSVDVTYTLTIYKDGVATKYYTFDSETLSEVADLYYTENFNDSVKRSMAVDILNLGTAAQLHFASEGPENNTLSTFSAPNMNVDQQYKTSYGSISEIEGTRDSEITTQMLFKSAPSLYYTINLAKAGCTDPSALTFTATYYSKGLSKTETRTVNGSELSTEVGGEGQYGKYGLYYFAFDQVALFDTNKMVTLTITDGTNTWTHEYSVESQLSKNIDATGTVGDLYRAVASFAASARNFWPDY